MDKDERDEDRRLDEKDASWLQQAMADQCVICREPCDGRGGGTAEMYDPSAEDHEVGMGFAHGIVHAECGLGRGWEVA